MYPGAARARFSPGKGELGAKDDIKTGKGGDWTVKGTVPFHQSEGNRGVLTVGATVSCKSRIGRQTPTLGVVHAGS